jgi:hypothetical protein
MSPLPVQTPALGRRLPVGAERSPAGVHFRVWAPGRRAVSRVVDPGRYPWTDAGFPGLRMPGQAAVALAPSPAPAGEEEGSP